MEPCFQFLFKTLDNSVICLLKTSTFLFIQDKLIFPSYDAYILLVEKIWKHIPMYTTKCQSAKCEDDLLSCCSYLFKLRLFSSFIIFTCKGYLLSCLWKDYWVFEISEHRDGNFRVSNKEIVIKTVSLRILFTKSDLRKVGQHQAKNVAKRRQVT